MQATGNREYGEDADGSPETVGIFSTAIIARRKFVAMKTSGLITALQAELKKYGDLDVHFGNGIEYKITGVQHVAAKASNNPAPAHGPHLSQPERLVITGQSID